MRRQFRWIVMATALVTTWVACSPAMAIGYLSGVLEKPAYVRALTSLLDNAPAWTREILKRNGAYKSGLSSTTDIDGASHEIFLLCVGAQRCSDTTMVVMFAPNGAQAWAGLNQKGTISYLGAPSDAQQAALKRELYVPPPAPATATGPYLFDVIKKPAYAQASRSLLDHAGKLPSWTRDVLTGNQVSYNSGPAMPAVVNGITYEMFTVCVKEYSCTATHLAIMFAQNGTQAWGLLVHEGAVSYLGAPSDAQLDVMRGALEANSVKWGLPGGK